MSRGEIRRFVENVSGATIIEFAVLGSAFVSMLFVAFLLGLYYLRVTMLDLAVQMVSRQLLVNQALTQAQFGNAVKAASYGLLDSETIYVAVQSASTFGAITPVANVAAGGALPYSPGTYGSDVLVQVGYTDASLASLLPTWVTQVSSAIAFQQEPSP